MGFSQNIDSINAVYRKFYNTRLLAVSPSGQYAVLNHYNSYGKDEDELLDTKTGKVTELHKNQNYVFLKNNRLLIQNLEYSRFHDLKNNRYNDIPGRFTASTDSLSQMVVLYSTVAQELVLASEDGKVIEKVPNIEAWQLNSHNSCLAWVANGVLVIRDLRKKTSGHFPFPHKVNWLSSDRNRVYVANIGTTCADLYIWQRMTGRITQRVIPSPHGFEYATGMNTYFEIREQEHLVLPLFSKVKLAYKDDPELKITYTNRNSRDHVLNYHMGIYNINENRWDYQPDTTLNLPVYHFLNDNGDFVIYDQAGDVVEEQQNPVLDLTLMLDYGKRSYILPKKRVDDVNYFWDHETAQFIYFEDQIWKSHNVVTGAEKILLPTESSGWSSKAHNGLAHMPEAGPVRIKNRSAIILANQFDYFILDLKNGRVKRITNGEGSQVKYQLQLSKEQYPASSWNIKTGEVYLDQPMTFSLLNKRTYKSGFARYWYREDKTVLYKQGHYKSMKPFGKGLFFTSHFALEPFTLTKMENAQYEVIYESMNNEKKSFETAGCQIFQYTTPYGTANGALLFPIGFDKIKKYPMVVNVYETQSRDALNFLPPYLRTSVGFNYMHYLMNGYLVLLPDLQYETSHVKNSVIAALEKSIDTAKQLAPVDDKNIGVLGLSYGGYETGLALTNSNYFKTGVAGVMVADLVSKALSNSEFIAMPNYMRAENQQSRMNISVFDGWKLYLENSPVYYLKNINTPILIWTGIQDKNVSPAQSKMFFLGMKRLKKKAVILEYTHERHNIFSSQNQLDLDIKIWQWFDHYLKNKPAAAWIAPLLL